MKTRFQAELLIRSRPAPLARAVLLALCLIYPARLSAQSDLNPTLVGSWPGFPRGGSQGVSCMTRGTSVYACVATGTGYPNDPGAGLQVFDITEPSKPRRVGGCPVSNLALDAAFWVAVSSNYAFVACGAWQTASGSLQVIDVSDPSRPVPVASHNTGYPGMGGLAVAGHYAYVSVSYKDGTDLTDGVRIIDVSNPTQPVRVASYDISDQTRDVTVVGNYAYLAVDVRDQPSRLEVIDVSDPAQPVLVGTCETGDAYGYQRNVTIVGNYAYVTMASSGLRVVDVSNPAQPFIVGSYDINGGKVAVFGHYGYFGSAILDVTDPAQPVCVGASGGLVVGYSGIAIVGNYACLGSGGLAVFDLSNPVQPVQVGSFDTAGGSASEVAVVGSHAYLADGSRGLSVLDVRNPTQPVLVGEYGLTNARNVSVVGPYAYVTESFWDPSRGCISRLHVFDVTDPGKPSLKGTYEAPGWGDRLTVAGNKAYVIEFIDPGPGRLHVIDVSDPARPVLVGGCATIGEGRAGTSDNNYVYVADFRAGLQVFDVSQPTQPVHVGGCAAMDDAADVTVADRYAYVAIDDSDLGGLEVFDVADPAQPVSAGRCQIGTQPASVYGKRVTVAGTFVYLTAISSRHVGDQGGRLFTGRLEVIDVSNPAAPVRVGGCITRNRGDPDWFPDQDIQVVGNYAYVTDAEWGLQIIRLRDVLTLNPPILSGDKLALCWTGGPGIKLQKTTILSPANWQDVTGSDGVSNIELPRGGAAAFFRLIKP